MPGTGGGDNARKQLLQRERAAQLRVVAEFKKIQKRIEAELYDLLLRIDNERRSTGNASASTLIRQARARELLNQVTDEINRLSRTLGLATSQTQTAAINIAQAQASNETRITSSLSFFDSDATRELIGIAGDGEPLAKHFAGVAPGVRQLMFDSLFAGIATGQSNQQIAKAINDAVGFGAARSMTIVRTETNRAYREASRKFYADNDGVKGWRWVAALDLTTCPICWALHGSIFQTRVKMATHPNCRCTMVPVFEGDPPFPTGPEKFAGLSPEQQKTILGPRRFELYKAGANLSDFVETNQTPFGLGRRIIPLDRVTFKPNPRLPGPPPAVTPTPTPALPAVPAIKPGDPVPTFATSLEAERYLERRFPNTKFDLDGVDMKGGFLQAQANEITRLMDLYPEAAAELKYFGNYSDPNKFVGTGATGRMERNANAHASFSGNYIGLSKKVYADADAYIKQKKYAKQIGWSVTDNPAGTITHEFGHTIDGWLKYRVSEARGFLKRGTGVADLSLTKYVDLERGVTTEIGELRDALLRKKKPTRAELSDYGRSKRTEQFAEGFSQYWNEPGNRSQFAIEQAKLIELAQTRTRYAKTELTHLIDLRGDELRAARREINELYKELGLKPPYKKNEL
jgi:SPP1 gp7 family putative phage head morphogenesis protein